MLWYRPEQEIKDTYYYSIRLGINEQARIYGYTTRVFYQGDAWTDLVKAEGIIVIGSNQLTAIQLKEIKSFRTTTSFCRTQYFSRRILLCLFRLSFINQRHCGSLY